MTDEEMEVDPDGGWDRDENMLDGLTKLVMGCVVVSLIVMIGALIVYADMLFTVLTTLFSK